MSARLVRVRGLLLPDLSSQYVPESYGQVLLAAEQEEVHKTSLFGQYRECQGDEFSDGAYDQ